MCDWLEVRNDHLKRLLTKFDEGLDYIIEEKTKVKKNGGTHYHHILITPNCFKELCMISQTQRAKEVRRYFIEMEKLVRRYHEIIQDDIYGELGLLKKNQKPKYNPKGGVLYIIKALNTNATLYKIGKTSNLKKRLTTYNADKANDIEPEFIIPVKDVTSRKLC